MSYARKLATEILGDCIKNLPSENFRVNCSALTREPPGSIYHVAFIGGFQQSEIGDAITIGDHVPSVAVQALQRVEAANFFCIQTFRGEKAASQDAICVALGHTANAIRGIGI